MKNNDKQFAERMIISSVISFVSKFPEINTLEMCVDRYRELKNMEVYGSLKEEKIKIENLLRAIRRYSKNYVEVTKEDVFSLFNTGYIKASEFKREEELKQQKAIINIPIKEIKEVMEKHPNISPEEIIELFNIGLSQAKEQLNQEHEIE